MYGTIIFWICSAILIFSYSSVGIQTPSSLTALWHIGALLTCLGGYWFWFFLRVDVSAEAHPWYRICLLYTSPSPRDATLSRMPSSA